MPWNMKPRGPVSTELGGSRGSADEAAKGRAWPKYEAQYLKHRLMNGGGKYGDAPFGDINPDVAQMVYYDKITEDYKQEADESLKAEFNQWLTGVHEDNVAPQDYVNGAGKPTRRFVYRDKKGHHPGDAMSNWKPTWWGATTLAHLPGVREYLRDQQIKSTEADFDMNLLAEHGPQDLQSAWAYFKHWVKGRPIGIEKPLTHPQNNVAFNRTEGFDLEPPGMRDSKQNVDKDVDPSREDGVQSQAPNIRRVNRVQPTVVEPDAAMQAEVAATTTDGQAVPSHFLEALNNTLRAFVNEQQNTNRNLHTQQVQTTARNQQIDRETANLRERLEAIRQAITRIPDPSAVIRQGFETLNSTMTRMTQTGTANANMIATEIGSRIDTLNDLINSQPGSEEYQEAVRDLLDAQVSEWRAYNEQQRERFDAAMNERTENERARLSLFVQVFGNATERLVQAMDLGIAHLQNDDRQRTAALLVNQHAMAQAMIDQNAAVAAANIAETRRVNNELLTTLNQQFTVLNERQQQMGQFIVGGMWNMFQWLTQDGIPGVTSALQQQAQITYQNTVQQIENKILLLTDKSQRLLLTDQSQSPQDVGLTQEEIVITDTDLEDVVRRNETLGQLYLMAHSPDPETQQQVWDEILLQVGIQQATIAHLTTRAAVNAQLMQRHIRYIASLNDEEAERQFINSADEAIAAAEEFQPLYNEVVQRCNAIREYVSSVQAPLRGEHVVYLAELGLLLSDAIRNGGVRIQQAINTQTMSQRDTRSSRRQRGQDGRAIPVFQNTQMLETDAYYAVRINVTGEFFTEFPRGRGGRQGTIEIGADTLENLIAEHLRTSPVALQRFAQQRLVVDDRYRRSLAKSAVNAIVAQPSVYAKNVVVVPGRTMQNQINSNAAALASGEPIVVNTGASSSGFQVEEMNTNDDE